MLRDPLDIGRFEPGGILLAAIRAAEAIYLFKGLLMQCGEAFQHLVLVSHLQQPFVLLLMPGSFYFPVVQNPVRLSHLFYR